MMFLFFFFFSSRRRHTRYIGDWSSDVCSSDLAVMNFREWLFEPIIKEITKMAMNQADLDTALTKLGQDVTAIVAQITALVEIGRASCRERVSMSGVAG